MYTMRKLMAILLSVFMLCTTIPYATVSAEYAEPAIVAVPVEEDQVGDEPESSACRHDYDNDDDVDCNVCGAVREVDCPLFTFNGYSISEAGDQLGFLFNILVEDVAVKAGTKCETDCTNAKIDVDGQHYAVKGFGAMASNNGTIPNDLMTNDRVINVKAVYLYRLESDSAAYAVRITQIPATHKDTVIIAVPYVIYEADGAEIVIFDDAQRSSVNGVLNS